MLIRYSYYSIFLNNFLLYCFKFLFLYFSYFLLCSSTAADIYAKLKFVTKYKLMEFLFLPSNVLKSLINLSDFFNFFDLTSFCLFFEDTFILSDLLNFMEHHSALNILSLSYKGSFINFNMSLLKKLFINRSLTLKSSIESIFFFYYSFFLRIHTNLIL